MPTTFPIPLRAHHVGSLKRMWDITRISLANRLFSNNYIDNLDDEFVDLAYDRVKKLFSNPDNIFQIVDGLPDFICSECKKLKECFNIGRKPILGSAFDDFTKDRFIAGIYGLKIGQVYTAKELRERAGF